MPTVRQMIAALGPDALKDYSEEDLNELRQRMEVEDNPPGLPPLPQPQEAPPSRIGQAASHFLGSIPDFVASSPFGAAAMGVERTDEQRKKALQVGGGGLGLASGLVSGGAIPALLMGGIGAVAPPRTPQEAIPAALGGGYGAAWNKLRQIPQVTRAAAPLRGGLAGLLGLAEAAGTGAMIEGGNRLNPEYAKKASQDSFLPKGAEALFSLPESMKPAVLPLVGAMSFGLPAISETVLRGVTRATPFMQSEMERGKRLAGRSFEDLRAARPERLKQAGSIQRLLSEANDARMANTAALRSSMAELDMHYAALKSEGLSLTGAAREAHRQELAAFRAARTKVQEEINANAIEIAQVREHNVGQRGSIQSLTGKQKRERAAAIQGKTEKLGEVGRLDAVSARQLADLKTRRGIVQAQVRAKKITAEVGGELTETLLRQEREVYDTVWKNTLKKIEANVADTHPTSADSALLAQQGNTRVANKTVAELQTARQQLMAKKAELIAAGVPESLVSQELAETSLKLARLQKRKVILKGKLSGIQSDLVRYRKLNPLSALANERDPSRFLDKLLSNETTDSELRGLVGFLQQSDNGVARIKALQDTVLDEFFYRTYSTKERVHSGMAGLFNGTDSVKGGFNADKLAALFANEDPAYVKQLVSETQEFANLFQKSSLRGAWGATISHVGGRIASLLPVALFYPSVRNNPYALGGVLGMSAVIGFPALLQAAAKNPSFGLSFREWIESGATAQALTANPWLQKELQRLSRPVSEEELAELAGVK